MDEDKRIQTRDYDPAEAEDRLISKQKRPNLNKKAYEDTAKSMSELFKEVNRRLSDGMMTKSYQDVNVLSTAISDYFTFVMNKRLLPSVTGLCLWLGISPETFYAIENCGDERSQALKTFRSMVTEFMAQLGFQREGNPAYQIYYEKSRFGFSDKPEMTLNVRMEGSGRKKGKPLREGFIGGIAIDVTAEEVDE